jgi:hypothetical protein
MPFCWAVEGPGAPPRALASLRAVSCFRPTDDLDKKQVDLCRTIEHVQQHCCEVLVGIGSDQQVVRVVPFLMSSLFRESMCFCLCFRRT